MAIDALPFVLDLDLDVFVSPVVEVNGDATYRAGSGEHQVAPEAEIMAAFAKFELSPDRKVPGAFIEHHREAYFFWRDLVASGRLKVPFDVVHVDAHSDLGNGATTVKLCERWAAIPDKLNEDPGGRVNSADYLAFALMNGWVRALVNLRRPDSPSDVPVILYKEFDPRTSRFTMKRFATGEIARTCDVGFAGANYEVLHEIRYAEGMIAEFKPIGRQPDFVFVARSPAFTPVEIDAFEPYIRACLTAL
jgi:hypothetical protein